MHFVTWRIRASARMYGKMNMTGGSTALLGKTNVTEVPRSGLCPLGTIFAGTQILNGEPIFPWNSSTERGSLTISLRSTWMCAWNMMFTFYDRKVCIVWMSTFALRSNCGSNFPPAQHQIGAVLVYQYKVEFLFLSYPYMELWRSSLMFRSFVYRYTRTQPTR